jgi:hypothetical protein
MLDEEKREAARRTRFNALGLSRANINALAALLIQTLHERGTFAKVGCNSFEIFTIAYEHLGFDGELTEMAIENLCTQNLAERVGCEVPASVHPRESIEWWRLQPKNGDSRPTHHSSGPRA